MKSEAKKITLIILLFFISSNFAYPKDQCSETVKVQGYSYWLKDISDGTSIISDDENERKWFSLSNPAKCYISLQSEINNPGSRFWGYVKALELLGDDFRQENLFKIKKLTGLEFSNQKQLKYWLESNRKNLFWSFERNKLIVLKDGFNCKQIQPSNGKLYWFNYSIGSVKNMDTSARDRLWSNLKDDSQCFITPLNEINDRATMLESFKESLESLDTDNDEDVQEIFYKLKIITGKDFGSIYEINESINKAKNESKI